MSQPDINKTGRDIEDLIQTLTYHGPGSNFGFDTAGDAARALGEMGDRRAVEPLIAALKRKGGVQKEKIQDNDGNTYTASFEDMEAIVRVRAAEALGKIGDTRAVEPLIEALRDKKEKVKKNAAVALGTIKDKRAVLPLIDTFNKGIKSTEMDEYRAFGEMARALGMIGDKRAVLPLMKWLDEFPWEPDYQGEMIAEGVIWALGELGDSRAVGRINRCLDWKDEKWKKLTREALNKIAESNKKSVNNPSKWIKDLFGR